MIVNLLVPFLESIELIFFQPILLCNILVLWFAWPTRLLQYDTFLLKKKKRYGTAGEEDKG